MREPFDARSSMLFVPVLFLYGLCYYVYVLLVMKFP
jgi:hypothetical protein